MISVNHSSEMVQLVLLQESDAPTMADKFLKYSSKSAWSTQLYYV